MSSRIVRGDTVIVICGKDRGKKGTVKRVLRDRDQVLVEGVNMVRRHQRPGPRNPAGGIVEREQPIHASNVMPVDPKSGKGTRIHHRMLDGGKKIRVAGSGEELPVVRG